MMDLLQDNLSLLNVLQEISETDNCGEEGRKDTDAVVDEAEGIDRLDENVSVNEGGKKDPITRRKELLVDSGLAEKLIEACSEMAGNLLKSKFGKEVIYEVATGGADGILHPTLDEKLNTLYEAIASLVAEPKSEGSEEHLLEQFHSSRTLRKLVLDCSAFASTLWEKALKGRCADWAKGHSSKVISAFLETSDPAVSGLAKKELQPLIDSGVLRLPEIGNKADNEG